MQSDSTLGYSNDGGFRAGTCYQYYVFNILTRKKLSLIEKPLIAMEKAVRESNNNKIDFSKKNIFVQNC